MRVDGRILRVDEEIFESGKKKLRIQKYSDTCGRGLICQPENYWLVKRRILLCNVLNI